MKTASLYSSLQAYIPYALLGILVAGMVVNLSLQSPLSLENEVEIEIPPGASATAVMETLIAQGMIDTKLPMRIRMKLLNLEGSLQAGVYVVRQGDTAESVILSLIHISEPTSPY